MENLKKARTSKGFTQDKLSKIVGVARSSISMWENGDSQPDNEMLIKLSGVLDVSIDYLLGNANAVSKDELSELLQHAKDDPDKRMLFSLTKNAKPEDVKTVIRILQGFNQE